MSLLKKQNNSQTKISNNGKNALSKRLISEIPKPKNQKIKKQYETKEKKENDNLNYINDNISKKQNNILKKNLNESTYSTSTNTTITNLQYCISERMIKVPKIFYKKKAHKTCFSSNKNKNQINEEKFNDENFNNSNIINNKLNNNNTNLNNKNKENNFKNNIENIKYNKSSDNKNLNNIKKNDITNFLNLEINLEDLLLIDEKINQIKESFTQVKNFQNDILQLQIYEWWNFYLNSSINGDFKQYFIDNYSKNIIHFYQIIQYAFMMILYDLCFLENLIERNKNKINSVLNLLQRNFLLICDYILTKINIEYNNNLWVEKINILLKNQLPKNNSSQNNIEQIKINNQISYNIINDILLIIHVIYDLNNEKIKINKNLNLQNPKSLFYLYNIFYDKDQNEILSISNDMVKKIFFGKIYKCPNPKSSQVPANLQLILSENKEDETIISNETNEEINTHFITYENENINEINNIYNNETKQIFTVSNINFMEEEEEYNNNNIYNNSFNLPKNFSYKNKMKYFSNFTNENSSITKIPFLKYLPQKKLTLVLDLDETIISFLMTNIKTGEGKLRLRPYLKNFLEEISKIYEIVIFTAGTKDYADPILDIIEKENKYFSYRLYRKHTIVMGNYYIKDISRLGRDLSKIIIVDNMPQNFRLQKENGILIHSFFGEDENDNALFHLKKVLVRIFEENDDVRNCIKKYKNEIIRKISSKNDIYFEG